MTRHSASTGAIIAIAAVAAFAQDFVTFKDQPAQDLFVASRSAVSRSDGSVKDLRGLILKGRATLAQAGASPAESAVVIKILLPDSYLRIDTMSGSLKATGFQGNHLLTAITEGGQTSQPPAAMTEALLKSERARLTRLLLGSMAVLTPALRLVGRSAPGIGRMERPSETTPGGASYASANEMRLIEFSGPDGFYTRFVVDTAHRPERLEFRAAKDEIWTTTFSDRRAVGGLLMPYRMVTTGHGAVREDLRLDEILVNPELAKGDFTVAR